MSEKMTITVEGYDAAQVKEWLSERVNREIAEAMNGAVRTEIARCVENLVVDLAKERVVSEIEAVLAAGWTCTNQYGEPTGRTLTLRDRVRGFFDSKESHYDRSNRVEKWVEEGVKRSLETAMNEEIKSARERLRAAFDDVLKAKFADTIRKALGVNT